MQAFVYFMYMVMQCQVQCFVFLYMCFRWGQSLLENSKIIHSKTKHRCQIWSFSKCNNSGPMMDVSLRALGGISAYTCLGWDLPKLSEFQVHKERECCASSSKRLTEIVCIIYHLVVACGHKYSLELGMSSTTTDTLLNLMTTFFNVSAKSK